MWGFIGACGAKSAKGARKFRASTLYVILITGLVPWLMNRDYYSSNI